MESPLDVLSRAASLVETTEIHNSIYKRSSPFDPRESPGREFPTKILKQERLKDRQELSTALQIDQDHFDKLNKKTTTAGTQTQFSSFNPGSNINYSYYPHPDTNLPPPPYIPPPPHPPLAEQNTPLNLSLSNASVKEVAQNRPSVITCIPRNTFSSHSPPRTPSPLQVVVSDSSIEEHFRRSLGNVYSVPEQDSLQITDDSTSPVSLPDPNISTTGSVDDHFAKSLGNTTWTAIKAKNDLVALDLFTGTVDDHFAKALGGDTWLRIKAEKEPNCSSSSASNSPQQVSLMTNL